MSIADRPRFTGRSLVLLRQGAVAQDIQMLRERVATRSVDSIVSFENLGVAVVDAAPEELSTSTRSLTDSPILAIEPERFFYPIVNLKDTATSTQLDESEYTWGLQATGVVDSDATGAGMKVAILDTGLDLKHPDFQGRTIVSKSFVPDEDVQDVLGHGTHCAGTACGGLKPSKSPRYGVAHEAEIYVGKVLGNLGFGNGAWILAGMEWALASGCHIISMSLGSATEPGEPFSEFYETVAKRILGRGTLVIAAAGNESDRARGIIKPVASPANCPSIMAVAALDSKLQVADFSCGGTDAEGGQVDIAAPGVDVYSSVPMPKQYDRYAGTSMATPHVAGIAALHAQTTGLRGRELWSVLTQNALRLNLPSRDVGIGLAQAPVQ
ncbi:S8 family peptidase [Chlorogloeopsis sp. ULAP02]|uniref:S8 family peptidase n=1 Tax=Chlorogloeopsis sp. ULAP02 TaxID=3107926 RepID=UPI003137427C